MAKHRFAVRRVSQRYLRGGETPTGITVNVWDDSPPGAPILVEGDLPLGVDPFGLVDFLAGVAVGNGWEIKGDKRPYKWMGARSPHEFIIEHPTMREYDDAKDNEAHNEFLNALVDMYKGLEYGGYPLNVISES